MARARALSMWKTNIKNSWQQLAIKDVSIQSQNGIEAADSNIKQPQVEVGAELKISALVGLGKLGPDDVAVEIYHGIVDSWGNINNGVPNRMTYDKRGQQEGEHYYTGSIPCRASGQHGFAVRILPKNEDLVDPYEPGLILWEAASQGNPW
jgi:starch phosphorylase